MVSMERFGNSVQWIWKALVIPCGGKGMVW